MIIGRPTLKPVLPLGDPSDTAATMRVTSPYGDRPGGFHAAIDIGNYVAGDTLIACGDATVVDVGYLAGEWSSPKPSDAWWNAQPLNPATGQRGGLYGPPSRWAGPVWGGQQIILALEGGWVAGYAHCATTRVSRGQRVTRGMSIGTVGDTGSAYRQPHLHFGLRFGGVWRDPWPLINGGAHPHREEDDPMRFGGAEVAPIAGAAQFKLTSDAHLRREPNRTESIKVFPVGTVFYAAYTVDGEAVGTNDQWFETRLYTGMAYELGYLHTSVGERIEPPATGVDPTVAAKRIYEAADATARAARRQADTYRPS